MDETIVITRVQEPDMEAHEQYQKYMDMYLKLSEALTPIFSL
jgi:sugar (pentulose or hexulose) kinase